jgi:hypothetical protein
VQTHLTSEGSLVRTQLRPPDFQLEPAGELARAQDQSIRQSLETAADLAVGQHLNAVAALTCNWTINRAWDLAWNNARPLRAVRDDPLAHGLFLDSLAASTALTSRMLLVAV